MEKGEVFSNGCNYGNNRKQSRFPFVKEERHLISSLSQSQNSNNNLEWLALIYTCWQMFNYCTVKILLLMRIVLINFVKKKLTKVNKYCPV